MQNTSLHKNGKEYTGITDTPQFFKKYGSQRENLSQFTEAQKEANS